MAHDWQPEPDDGAERVPPHDVAAEQSVLGAMLLSADAIADVVEVLRPADFYRPAHETIYTAILELYGRGEAVDAITINGHLQRTGQTRTAGGAPYLHTLTASVPVAGNAGYYADLVREKAVLRGLAEASQRIGQWAYAAQGDVDTIVDRAQAAIYDVTEHRTSQDYRPIGDVLEGALDEIESISHRGDALVGIPTGFADLDDLLNGLHPGQMITVAARPGLGKSTLALDFCRHASIKHALPSVIFSLEMSHTEIATRLLSAEARVPLHHLRSGRMGHDDWERLASTMPQVSEAPLYIDDSPNLSMTEIRAKARRLKQRHRLRLVVIDYLQLMSSGRRVESRQLEVSEFSRQLKLLAKELEVPVVAVSQLNRGAEQRTNKRPLLSDLRESGAIEQDSDVVILLHRDDAYDRESTRPGEADLIVAKHRNGPTKDVALAFQGHYSRFVDMANP
jgi:replicative DNA helicase